MRAWAVIALSLLSLVPACAVAGDEIGFASPKPAAAEANRAAIADYFRSEHRGGRCPEGLRYTEQGCERQPLWTVGVPLDPSVTVEPLPADLLAQMASAPEGHTYVRVRDHVLLMESRSRVIEGDILDLGRVGFGRIAPRLRLSGGSGAFQ